jgi:ubiquinone/menaquinone biosynthesis C-methylase UbiE
VKRPANDPLLSALSGMLDWQQLRVFLSEALATVPSGTADRWQHMATFVNARCPGSRPQPPMEFERAFRSLSELKLPGASRLATDPTAGRDLWTQLFYRVVRSVFDPGQTFLNLGYQGPARHRPFSLRTEDEPSRPYIQIYDHLIGDTPLADRTILEIGCGWGGGCSYVASYFKPRRVVGLDLVESNIATCRTHAASDQMFVIGNATALPLASASFDVVINVESSHNYKSFVDFVREVHRVLVAGGVFLLGDLRPTPDAWKAVRETLTGARFALVTEEDLTQGVQQAMAAQAGAKRALLEDARFDGMDRPSLAEIMLCPGSASYERLKTSGAQFRILRTEKRSES